MIANAWSIAPPDADRQRELIEALGILPVTAQVLLNRGITTIAAARAFLHPKLADLPDPFLLPDMEVAVERIVRALRARERIAVFGDYDVDGVTSAALLVRFFRALEVEIDVHIPRRLGEGYGLSLEALTQLKERGVQLVITVDNGTRSVAEVAAARAMGLDVIITDHHEVGEELPPALAMVNPKRPENRYPERELAGCGVAFVLMMALRKRLRALDMFPGHEPNLKEHLDLVATGTIADVMPLTGVNRVFARFGLKQLRLSAKPGVAALLEVSGLSDVEKELRAGQVAFRIAPRLNAAGRLGDAHAAFECLVTDDAARAQELAASLQQSNSQRQALEERLIAEVCAHIEETGQRDAAGFVAYAPAWHPGVVGIVAARIARMFDRPCAVAGADGYFGKGSVRSARGVNVVRALARAADVLVKFGGHAEAAGFTIEPRNVEAFRAHFNRACAELAVADVSSALKVDAEIESSAITAQLVDELELLEPHGVGNPEPVICARDLKVLESRVVGSNHLRLRVQSAGAVFTAIGFDMAPLAGSIGTQPFMAFVPQYSTWNGVTSIQLKLKAFLV